MSGITEILQMIEADGPTLVNSTTETSLTPTPKLVIPAGCLAMGRALRVRAQGRISNIITSPGTLTLGLYLVEQYAKTRVKVMDLGAIPLNAVAKVDVGWELDLLGVVRGHREFSAFMWSGHWVSEALIGAPLPAAGGAGVRVLPVSAMGLGALFDATKVQEVDLTAAFSVANAGNGITLHQLVVEGFRSGE